MTTSEKLQLSISLHHCGIQIKKQNLHRQFPQESESQILERLTQWLKQSKSSHSSVHKIKQY